MGQVFGVALSAYQFFVPQAIRVQIFRWRHPQSRLELKLHHVGRSAINAFMESISSEKRLRGNVLEIGAGERTLNKQLFAKTAKNYWRSDIKTGPNREAHPDLVCDCVRLPFRPGSLDALVCSEVFEHIRDLDAALRESAKTLKRGGHLVLAIPFFYPLHGVDSREHGDYWRLTPGNIKSLLEPEFVLVKETSAHLFAPDDPFVVNIQMLWQRK